MADPPLDPGRALTQLRVMIDPQACQHRVAAAVMQAIFDASIGEDDGKPAAYVISTEVVATLINVMALILEGAPGCETPRGVRDLTEGIGRAILRQMREIRKITETTGQRPFEAVYTRTDGHVQPRAPGP